MATNRFFNQEYPSRYRNKLDLEINLNESKKKYNLKMDIGQGAPVLNNDKYEFYFTHVHSPTLPGDDLYAIMNTWRNFVDYLVKEEFDTNSLLVGELNIKVTSENHDPILINKVEITVEQAKQELEKCKDQLECMTAEYTKSCFCNVF